MFLKPTKKTFYYNFFPTKEQEAKWKACKGQEGGYVGRRLVEIRDVYPPPPAVNSDKPLWIKKTLRVDEIESGKLILSWDYTFEGILRYWWFEPATRVCAGDKVGVALWDVTNKELPIKYDAYLQIDKDEFHISCIAMMCNRHLRVRDEVLLYWASDQACFKYKLL